MELVLRLLDAHTDKFGLDGSVAIPVPDFALGVFPWQQNWQQVQELENYGHYLYLHRAPVLPSLEIIAEDQPWSDGWLTVIYLDWRGMDLRPNPLQCSSSNRSLFPGN